MVAIGTTDELVYRIELNPFGNSGCNPWCILHALLQLMFEVSCTFTQTLLVDFCGPKLDLLITVLLLSLMPTTLCLTTLIMSYYLFLLLVPTLCI